MSGQPDPRLQQAMSHWRSRRPREAVGLCRQVLADRPGDAQASLLLASIARQTGGAAESVRLLEEARRHHPDHPAIEPELAASMVVANRAAEAMPTLQKLVSERPDNPVAHYWLGQAYLKLWKPTQGIRHLERSRELNPANTEALLAIGAAYVSAGRPSAAERPLRDFLKAQPGSIPGKHSLAAALDYQNRTDEAETLYREILAKAPAHAPSIAGLARLLQARGRVEEAIELARPGATAPKPDPNLAAIYASLCVAAKRADDGRSAVRRALDAGPLPSQLESTLRFGLARIEDADGRHDEAFDEYARAHALYPRTFNAESRASFVDRSIETFSSAALPTLARSGVESRRPVLVVGMPRSGTTLVEQIIASHPDAAGAGELADIRAAYNELGGSIQGSPPACLASARTEQLAEIANRYLARLAETAPDAERVVDKMPHNYEVLGLVEMLLPGARVIHCTRDPLDTCVSCFMTQLSPAHDYAHRLEDLGAVYGHYRRLMAHWRKVLSIPMLEVAYEELVADTEAVSRRMIDFLGLPWDDRCLRFYENATVISTASVDQVREPIYASSVGRWKRYDRHLEPLRVSLATAGVSL